MREKSLWQCVTGVLEQNQGSLMNRSAEFQQILAEQKLGKGEERGREKEKLLSSNTIEQEPFFSHFLSECSLLVSQD